MSRIRFASMCILVVLGSTACGSADSASEEVNAGSDLVLDRAVVVTYETPEILEGESFVVRAWSDVVVGQRQRFSVAMVDSELGVNQDTCEQALAMAAEQAANTGNVSSEVCVERFQPIKERFHELRVVDSSGEVTLMLSSEATLPYVVNVALNTDDEQSGCPVIGHIELGPNQDRVDMAVDSYACDGD